MSHSIGAIKFNDGSIRYYEYDGTSDIVLSCHYSTCEEVFDNWRNQPNNHCKCGKEEDVSIFSSYGRGFYFLGKACRFCYSVRPNDLDFDEETDDWANNLFKSVISHDS